MNWLTVVSFDILGWPGAYATRRIQIVTVLLFAVFRTIYKTDSFKIFATGGSVGQSPGNVDALSIDQLVSFEDSGWSVDWPFLFSPVELDKADIEGGTAAREAVHTERRCKTEFTMLFRRCGNEPFTM